MCNSDVDCLYGARCVAHESSSNKLCSCALIPCAQEETLSENKIISRPVCGSDGVTYRNPCGLKLAACGKGKNITTAKLEPCEGDYNDQNGNIEFKFAVHLQIKVIFQTNVKLIILILFT